ncbi:MAG: FkbM family methyltransferase [Gammaproteobacteria bacterium]
MFGFNAQKNGLRKLAAEERRLIASLPWWSEIFLPTEKIPLEERVEGLRRVKAMYARWSIEFSPRLRALRERYQGMRRCFIIGNGPSLNQTDLSKLRDEVIFGVNGIFLNFEAMGFRPTFYVVEDHLVAEDRAEQINRLRGMTKLFPINLAYCLDEGPDTIFFNHQPRISHPHGFDFSTDASQVTYTGCTVTFTCMQLAYYLGFQEIYLIGIDASYAVPATTEKYDSYGTTVLDMSEDDPNHFHPDYFGKGYRWHDPQVDKMIEAYEEARRVTEGHAVKILNATVGGKLEVFERVQYHRLFTPRALGAAVRRQVYPRTLILDSTRLGSISATGQVKKRLFAGWPGEALLQVHAWKRIGLGLYRGWAPPSDDTPAVAAAEAWEACLAFQPDVIYYRPHDRPEAFHQWAEAVMDGLGVPVVTHLMDDWMAKLGGGAGAEKSLRRILSRSAACLSIGEAMSREFNKRYGVPFYPVANCVEPEEWNVLESGRRASREAAEPVVIRYVGGLAEDMTLASVADVARAVDSLHEECGLIFEVYTMGPWLEAGRNALKGFRGVTVHEGNMSEEAHQRLLLESDLLVIAYNFDEASLRYVRYSMANKMPECLASGVPVLAYGPRELATIDYLATHGVAEIVTEREPRRLSSAMRHLAADSDYARNLGERGRAFVFERHACEGVRAGFYKILVEAAARHGWAENQIPRSAADAGLVGVFERQEQAHFDAVRWVGKLLGETSQGVMVDVGAHHGEALAGFLDRGWRVYALEPDEANRAQLKARFGAHSGITIDARTVSDTVRTEAPAFALQEPTGFSSASVFPESPRAIGSIASSTIDQALRLYGIGQVDFLRIDVGGHALSVLKGVPWETMQPAVVVCEFGDLKTLPLGHCFHDLARYLLDRGYQVWVSEWHPKVPCSVRHDWRRLVSYPCHVASADAWGHLLAFRQSPPEDSLRAAATVVWDASVPRPQKGASRVAPDPMAKSQVPFMQMAKYSLHHFVAIYLQRKHPAIARFARSALFGLRATRAAFRRWTV